MYKIYRKIRVVHITFIFVALMIFLFIHYPVYAVGTLIVVIFICGFGAPDFDLLKLFSTETFWEKNLKEKERLLALDEARKNPNIKLLPIEHLGKEVIFLGALGPKPFFEIEGERFFALSDTGFIDSGTIVVIEDMRLDHYVVRAVDVTKE